MERGLYGGFWLPRINSYGFLIVRSIFVCLFKRVKKNFQKENVSNCDKNAFSMRVAYFSGKSHEKSVEKAEIEHKRVTAHKCFLAGSSQNSSPPNGDGGSTGMGSLSWKAACKVRRVVVTERCVVARGRRLMASNAAAITVPAPVVATSLAGRDTAALSAKAAVLAVPAAAVWLRPEYAA